MSLKTNDDIFVLKFFNMLILKGYGAGSPAVQHFQNTHACKLFILRQLTDVL